MTGLEQCGFAVRLVGVADDAETESFTVGIADNEVGDGRVLLLSVPTGDYEDDDVREGWATYCISDESAAVVYGGVEECVLEDNVLTLRFDERAQRELGVGAECRYPLLVDERAKAELSAGLARALTAGLDGLGMPRRLELSG